MKTAPFKICTTCSKQWETLEDFLADPELKLAGYQVAFENLKGGLFYFNHLHENCGTTLAIAVHEFTGLSDRPILALRGEQPGGCCPELCVRQGALDPCPVECECRWVREIMQVIRNWKKQSV
jgi:hypothetical protein